jgi:glutamate-1-semialdehyde aminotransferase
MNWERTLSLIPDGVQTLSKMPSKYVNGVYPKYISHGKGSKVYADGQEYIDYTCGLGAILLGHANQEVNQAVFQQAERGTLFGLPHESETLLAEKIVELLPVDKVRFVKTGSEATSAAIKIARAHTKAETIFCCGYHGWHEWYNQTTPKNKGCAKSKVYQFKYNDIAGLRALFRRHKKVAAVIMEPYVYDEPKENFLKEVKNVCEQNKSLLIFDEVVTGFRTQHWCAANKFKIKPDLMCIGKAMGNGYPIGAVCGNKDIMDVLKGDCFVSSTFGGELIGIAAALATINVIENRGVANHLNDMGNRVKSNFNIIAGNEGVKAECVGYGCRTHFKFEDPIEKSAFWQECIKKGVFFGHAQFTSFAHDLGDADNTISAMRHALRMLNKYRGHTKDLLEGTAAKETLRLVS